MLYSEIITVLAYAFEGLVIINWRIFQLDPCQPGNIPAVLGRPIASTCANVI